MATKSLFIGIVGKSSNHLSSRVDDLIFFIFNSLMYLVGFCSTRINDRGFSPTNTLSSGSIMIYFNPSNVGSALIQQYFSVGLEFLSLNLPIG